MMTFIINQWKFSTSLS